MQVFNNATGSRVVLRLADAVVVNRAELSAIDGETGDGDHGINLARGFADAARLIRREEMSFSEALRCVGDVLLTSTGGTIGPLYGSAFTAFAQSTIMVTGIDGEIFAQMLRAGLDRLRLLGMVRRGDKSVVDAFEPATDAFDFAWQRDGSFVSALAAMAVAANAGRDATRFLVARVGRAASLRERSRGHLDAGAASCALILNALSTGIQRELTFST